MSRRQRFGERTRMRGHRTSSEYVPAPARRDRDRERVRNLLLEGAASPPADVADSAYFAELRQQAREAGRE